MIQLTSTPIGRNPSDRVRTSQLPVAVWQITITASERSHNRSPPFPSITLSYASLYRTSQMKRWYLYKGYESYRHYISAKRTIRNRKRRNGKSYTERVNKVVDSPGNSKVKYPILAVSSSALGLNGWRLFNRLGSSDVHRVRDVEFNGLESHRIATSNLLRGIMARPAVSALGFSVVRYSKIAWCSLPNLSQCLFENMCFCLEESSFSFPLPSSEGVLSPQQAGLFASTAARTSLGSSACNGRAREFSVQS